MTCKGPLPKEVVREALKCCRDVYPHDQDFLVSRKVAGHSLGGATATLIADLLWQSGNKNISLVTAGSPRPGGRRLRQRVKDLEHIRFVHGNDIVPRTPPWLAGFVHTHPLIYLPDEVETRFDGVADHNMGDYYKAAEKMLTPKGKYSCSEPT